MVYEARDSIDVYYRWNRIEQLLSTKAIIHVLHNNISIHTEYLEFACYTRITG